MLARSRQLVAAAIALGLILASAVASAAGATSRPGPVVFAPYLDMTLDPPPNLTAIHQASGVRQASLGFVTARGGNACTPTWGGYASDPAGGAAAFERGSVAVFQRSGGSVVTSFGGQAGTELASACRSISTLKHAYASVVAAYHPTRVDFDVEGAAVSERAAITRRSQAIAALQHRFRRLRVSFTLPVLPTGLDPGALGVLRSAIAHHVKVTYVNVMTMDYGDAAAPDPAGKMGSYAIQSARSVSRQLRSLYRHLSAKRRMRMLGVTPMIGINDTSDEVFTLSDAAQLAGFARSQHLGMLGFWSVNRDHQCPQAAIQAEDSCSGLAQSDFQFARTFQK
ncbi:MAG TPA: chitinase [Solirubrobacteraceae bacterium]